MIKIGMTGAQGTGKTSMAQAMAQSPAFKDFVLVPSTARQIKDYGYPINREATELSQILVPVLRMVDEWETMTSPQNTLYKQGIISDRTLIDSLAYTYYQNEYVWENGALIENVTRRLTEMHMQSYHFVLYFPVYWEAEEDGVRDADESYRNRIDDYVIQSLEMLNVPYLTVPDVSPEERVEWFIGEVQELYAEAEKQYLRRYGNGLL
ncbi:thymidylate kinase [Streptomyces phage StarPlatinum]|uniref:Thymidylate kinase n=1 Tax=Streptomyces phage StarPlatinum TaxID=2283265 RepID=A0A345M8M4_9CAUD|nr:thymidylate kinase [Streptomyces phage StarPlatinum]AXH66845.1 thymidylate kinase [Streptomyces phage StarPlatinum]